MRGKEGIFERAIRGIQRAKGCPGIKVMINSVFSKLNLGAVEGLVHLADELGVPIYLCPIETGIGRAGFAESKEGLGASPQELEEFARTVMGLKRRGFRINNSLTYLRTFIGGKKPFRCHTQKVAVSIDANGDVKNCIAREPFGNVSRTPLREILESERVRQARRQSESCHACNNPDVIDCSYVWELRPESVWSFARVFLD
ncbi:MAG: hypothetical protein AMJ81_10105 [Phycisphaerae bacterium SM23_33]|nr:MAG: hypothetical protein AMJ81_10105 [Phycisphaerae bacterium SM23_33]